MEEEFCSRFGKGRLLRLKLKALRRGVWFASLCRIDRVLFDLTMRIASKVRSSKLAESLSSIMRKLKDAFENRVARVSIDVGFTLARRLSLLAGKWGNSSAEAWAADSGFAKFLAIMQVNNGEWTDSGCRM